MLDTENALERAGYTDVSVDFDSANSIDVVTVSYGPSSPESTERAAEIVWRTLKLRFDIVHVEPGGSVAQAYGRAELETRFGPRPAGFDERSIGDEFERIGLQVILGLAGAGIVGVGVIVVVVVLVMRSRRRRRDEQARAWAAWSQQQQVWPQQQQPGWTQQVPGWPPPGQWGPPPPSR